MSALKVIPYPCAALPVTWRTLHFALPSSDSGSYSYPRSLLYN
uniref:Uncharacterized protein n=1 Tax=Aegilops tauschii subsp. strangulata TaxID=200361 RepID=A0A453KQB1_AEGTS